MDEPTNDPAAPPPPSRWREPKGRFTEPATPLQAARYALRRSAKDLVPELRQLCPGHGSGKDCKLDQSKISDYEHKRRRPSLTHVEVFCRFFQKSPEDLGLITWRDPESGPAGGEDAPDPTPAQLTADWLRDSATNIATALLQALLSCPVAPADALRAIIDDSARPAAQDASGDD